MSEQKELILIIDDDIDVRECLEDFLSEYGYNVKTLASGIQGIEFIKETYVDLILTDFKMPGLNGIEFMVKIKSINPEIPVIMMTGYGSIEGAVEAMRQGALSYLVKPVNLIELDMLIKTALERKKLLLENLELKKQLSEKYKFSEIISVSGAMEEVLDISIRSASSKASVLIRGESGTGKELIARAVHYASPRNKKPLVIVNCGVLNENLIESILFGHEKGSFTGAYKQTKGKFELAHKGTIFIDEIGDLPLQCQIKLLRVLEEGTFERLGSQETINIDVRIIAATNRPLEQMIQEKLFREDLFYRLNVIQINLPPLRKRKEDIRSLLEYYLGFFAKDNIKEIKGYSPEAMDCLIKYDYPGNVRELKNMVEQMVVLTRNNLISLNDLPANISKNYMVENLVMGSLDRKVEELEKMLILEALKQCDYLQNKAAKLLGITERRFRYKLKNLNIEV
jgi:DNA-binding NtrC family response regulator